MPEIRSSVQKILKQNEFKFKKLSKLFIWQKSLTQFFISATNQIYLTFKISYTYKIISMFDALNNIIFL